MKFVKSYIKNNQNKLGIITKYGKEIVCLDKSGFQNYQ